MTLNELEVFEDEHMTVPDNEDEAFCVGFERSDKDQNVENWFRVFISTKRLLRLGTLADNIHADGTYKMNIEGFPLLVVGASDVGGRFNLFDLMLSSRETSEDYEFMFRSLRHGVENIIGGKLQFSVLIADGAMVIHNGASRIFKDIEFTTVMCEFHVMKNVRKFKSNDSSNKEKILEDLRCLKMAYSQQVYGIILIIGDMAIC